MSGHSKWSTIKHKKAATDKKRAKIFTTLAKDLTMAARDGGGDPEFNAALGLAIDKAKAANMPKDNIERAIKRGTGELEGGVLEEIMYEAYAPHGVGLLVETVTDNRNRSVADVRHIVNKNGGNMAASGSVAWQFTRKGYIAIEEYDEDELFMVAAEAGAEDIEFDDVAEIFVEVTDFHKVQTALREAGYKLIEANLMYDSNNPMSLDPQEALQVMKFIEAVEDVDDVQNVHSTLDISDEAIALMEEA
ncbi:MAG: YebC/PmpR family DNA-binding transcriptional regulator [Chloroflexi bacterium]|nr:YebC/PmpR family DNA-binding transcriptional regulator [Chloroflexota bacterium]